jgi:hypothetical protein
MVKYPESLDGKPPLSQKRRWWRFFRTPPAGRTPVQLKCRSLPPPCSVQSGIEKAGHFGWNLYIVNSTSPCDP